MLAPANLLLEFVLSLLVPFLTAGSLTDPALARRAAEETIAAYKAAGQDQLVTVAQLVAFALTALDNLRLSMPPDLSLSMKLKLRGNANALNRSSQHATATLDRQRRPVAPPQRDQAEVLASLEAAKTVVQQALAARTSTPPAPNRPAVAPPAPNQPVVPPIEPTATLASPAAIGEPPTPRPTRPKRSLPPAAGRDSDLAWASAMTGVAAEYTAELPNLPPEQQPAHLARIAALSKISAMLGAGEAPPLKARLLAGTNLRG